MNIHGLYPANAFLRTALKSVVLVFSAAAAIFCAATGFGLLKVLVLAVDSGTQIGFAELTTHSATMLLFMALAGLSACMARKVI